LPSSPSNDLRRKVYSMFNQRPLSEQITSMMTCRLRIGDTADGQSYHYPHLFTHP
jgi:hypothetical protein